MCQKPVSISTVRGEKTLAVSCTVEPNYQSIDNRYSSDFNRYSTVPYISYEQIASTKDGSYALIIKPRGRSLILYLPSKWTLLIVEYIYSHAHRTSSIYCLNFCVFLRGAKQCWVRRGRAQDRAVCDGTAPHRSRFRFTYSLLPFSSFFFLPLSCCSKKSKMSLIYGVVAHGPTILAEHSNSSGNFGTGNNNATFGRQWSPGISLTHT